VYRSKEKPFWESGDVWTTRRGLDAYRSELRHLQDVRIPENSEAIGRAASFGDLSENSEWEAAIEEQRNLTSRAMQMETDLRAARLIEDVTLPENTVAPGITVRYQELPEGPEHTVTLLGPWDTHEENVISYRSPLASGILGLHPGDEARIQLPGGEVWLRLISVARAPL
jgi:transcription elongation factor GreA